MGEPSPTSGYLWFTASALASETRLMARCTMCTNTTEVDVSRLIERFGETPLRDLEPRLRCNWQGYHPSVPKPRCPGRGRFDIVPKLKQVLPTELVYYPTFKEGR